MNLSTAVPRVAELRPDHPALVFEGRTQSYGALAERAAHAAGALAAQGVQPGDRVGLLLPNVPAFPAAFLGTLRLGAIAVPINPALTRRELAHVLGDAGIGVVVSLPHVLSGLDPDVLAGVGVLLADEDGAVEGGPHAVPPVVDLAPDTPAVIIYSSGTTGVPKGVTLSHANIHTNVVTNAEECGFRPEDRVLLFMPLFHCYGLNVILNSAFEAGSTVVMERRFDPEATPRTIARERATMFFGVPTTFIMLLQRESLQDLASLRYSYCAAAPLPRELEDQWQARTGVLIHQAYGLSEASPCVAYNHVSEHRPGTIGQPSRGVCVRVVDPETGRDVPPGEVGEFWVKGPGVMLGYWGRPEATAAAIVDGWLRTGDLGRRDERDYLVITDRLKDLVIVGGLNVYPTEVEEVLYQHPAVAEAAVVGVPDPTMGERVRAYVSPRAGQRLEASELRAFLRDKLAEYKRPTSLHVLDSLPKGRTGKILRRVLREEARQEPALPAPTRRWTAHELRAWIVDWLRAELPDSGGPLDPRTPFADIGVDSLLAVRKAEALSQHLGRPVDATITWLHSTPEQLATHLADADPGPADADPAADADALADLSEAEAAALLEAELAELGL